MGNGDNFLRLFPFVFPPVALLPIWFNIFSSSLFVALRRLEFIEPPVVVMGPSSYLEDKVWLNAPLILPLNDERAGLLSLTYVSPPHPSTTSLCGDFAIFL